MAAFVTSAAYAQAPHPEERSACAASRRGRGGPGRLCWRSLLPHFQPDTRPTSGLESPRPRGVAPVIRVCYFPQAPASAACATPMRKPCTPEELDALSGIPMTAEEYRLARRVPRITSLRRALQLSEEAFFETYRIPAETVRDRESERSEPDVLGRVLLVLIARAPQEVARILAWPGDGPVPRG